MVVSCQFINNDMLKSSTDYSIFLNTDARVLANYVKKNDVVGIKKELKKNPNLLSFQDPVYGMSLLHLSIYNLDYRSFIALLESGVEIDIYDYSDGSTPLIMASGLDEKTHLKYVNELIKFGANINSYQSIAPEIKDPIGNTALMEATKFNNLEVCKLLIKNNANVNALTYDGLSALGYSILTNNFEITLLLLKNDADPNVKLFDKYDKFQNKRPVFLKDFLAKNQNIPYHDQIKHYLK